MAIEKSSFNPLPIHSMGLQTVEWTALTCETLVGMGSYGDVYRGSWQNTVVAIKALRLKTFSSNLRTEFERETKIMAYFRYQHIVCLYAICLEANHYALVMEYMAKGSLYQVLHEPREKLSWSIRWRIALDIGKGLAYLHSQSIIHRDLKSLNVLLDNSYCAKISDFGLAKIKLETNSITSTQHKQMNSVRWLAPELFKRDASADVFSDIYSYGIVLWEIATRQLPFQETPDNLLIKWITEGHQEKLPLESPLSYNKLIEWCWKPAIERPTAEQVVEQLVKGQATIKDEIRSWQIETAFLSTEHKTSEAIYTLRPALGKDIQKVIAFYQHHPVSGYEIQYIEAIDSPLLEEAFISQMSRLQQRHKNPAFIPSWLTEKIDIDKHSWRTTVYGLFEKLTKPHADLVWPSVKLLPLWHGTKSTILDSLFKTGYANLAVTDPGFFGKGIYGAHEAEYAYRIYASKYKQDSALILNWTAIFSAYPVIDDDKIKLDGKGNYANHDAHFIPVVPRNPHNPNEDVYYPTKPYEPHQYTEVVVFESAACLPRYLVHLTPIVINNNIPVPSGEQAYFQGKQQLKRYAYQQALEYFITAAEAGYPSAYLMLGFLYGNDGLVGPKAEATSSEYYQKAAENIDWFEQQAAKGIADAQNNLGFCCQHGIGVEKNLVEAFKYYQLAAKQGDSTAQMNIGLCYEQGWGTEKSLTSAIIAYQSAAKQGNSHAQVVLGNYYRRGECGLVRDHTQAFEYFKLASAQANPMANYWVGICYQRGEGIKKNDRQALIYLQKSAKLGYSPASKELELDIKKTPHTSRFFSEKSAPSIQNKLPYLTIDKNLLNPSKEQAYQIGRQFLIACEYTIAWRYFNQAAEADYPPAYLALGFLCEKLLDKDDPASELWYEKASCQFNWFYENAEKGYPDAQNGLGFCYQQGIGKPPDLVKAAASYQQAAEQGNITGQYNLALCYEQGKGVQKDMLQAVHYYQLAAKQGDRTAQFKLGLCYQRGKGVEKNIVKAITFLEDAADRGEVEAQFYLGKCYQAGEKGNISKDLVKAFHYYQLAAQQDHRDAQYQLKKLAQELPGLKSVNLNSPNNTSISLAKTEQNATPHCILM